MPHRFPRAAQCSFPEQIAARSGSGTCQHQNIALNAVDQKPVGLNVALPASTPVAGQVMISVLRRQRASHCKRFNHGFKKLNLQSALECAAAEMLRALGREESVSVTLQNERFPTRDYETFSLPAGVYRTLRVTIGAGEGHNWWCVVFPTLCTAASLDEFESAAASGGFTDGELRLITGADEGYVLKFKTLEWLEKLKALFD